MEVREQAMSIEKLIESMGIVLPNFDDEAYYGRTYGKMKTHHIVGNVLYLSGHTPVRNGVVVHPGRIGSEVTAEQAFLSILKRCCVSI